MLKMKVLLRHPWKPAALGEACTWPVLAQYVFVVDEEDVEVGGRIIAQALSLFPT